MQKKAFIIGIDRVLFGLITKILKQRSTKENKIQIKFYHPGECLRPQHQEEI